MSLLGDLVVRLTADNKQFNKSVEGAQQKTEKFMKFLLGAAGIAGAILIFKRLGKVAADMVRDFGVQEQAEAKLRAAIRATGRQAQISADSLFEFASELQRSTTWGDEATISAMALLQQLGNLNEQGLKEVIPGVQDMAAALGISLETAASLVGKTLGSTTNALSRYGIVIDATAPKEQKIVELTEQLAGKFGGLSKELAETTTGTIQQVGNAFADVREEAGELLTQLTENLLPTLLTIADTLKGVFGGIRAELKVRKLLGDPAEWYKATHNLDDAREAMEAMQTHMQNLIDTGDRRFRKTIEELRQRIYGLSLAMINMTDETRKSIPVIKEETEEDEKSKEGKEKRIRTLGNLIDMYRHAEEYIGQQYIPIESKLREETEKVTAVTWDALEAFKAIERQIPMVADSLKGLIDKYREQEEYFKQTYIPIISDLGTGNDELAQKYEDLKNTAISSAHQMYDAIGRISQNMLSQQLLNLRDEYDSRKAYIEATITDEEGKATALAALEEEFQQNQKEIQKEEAIRGRNFALFEAIVSGAAAIVNAFRTKPFVPFGLAMGALATALTGAQVAAIATTPIPKAKLGATLDQATALIAGEKGREYVLPDLRLDELGERINAAMMAHPINVMTTETPVHVTVVTPGGREICDYVTKGSRDRKVLIDRGSITE